MYNSSYEFPASQGWICPKCGRVYAPSVPMCQYCGGNSKPPTITTDSTTLSDKNWWDSYLKQTTANSGGNITYDDFEKYMSSVGGSDYWDSINKKWANCLQDISNEIKINLKEAIPEEILKTLKESNNDL